MKLKVKRIHRPARLPVRAKGKAAAYDISSYLETPLKIAPGKKEFVSTGIMIALPPGTAGLLWSRSGLAAKHDIEVGAGVIDEDYRGEVKVLLRNFGTEEMVINNHERIAQMIIQKVESPEVEECEELDETERGADGFGSSGVH